MTSGDNPIIVSLVLSISCPLFHTRTRSFFGLSKL